ncbi:hypothetical protein [Saccharolobus caldissimus]|uniref:hypothetical protein n=1 Tax=Saccharolobus caldissimus TaxID=1702097 RepID=UPI001E5C88B1|nr:hypothetical protein [Saccharolobus caldissimus]
MKYLTIILIIVISFVVLTSLGVYYFILLIHSNYVAFQITASLLGIFGAYTLWKKRKGR